MGERPKWPHKVPEDLVRWLLKNSVTKITHHWRMTGSDTSEDWLELHSEKDKRRVPTGFLAAYPEVKFAPDHARLIQVEGNPRVQETVEAIDKWEAANDRDRREYERLKRKFEAQP